MYERFYNLRERPFSLSPDPDYLYLSRVHKEALNYLRYGIEGRAGFVMVTAGVGCGKTTLIQTVMRGLDRQVSVSRLVNTMLDARDLIEAVMLDFGLDLAHGLSKPQLLHMLAGYLVEQRSAGRLALLVIDEAQNLSLPALEEVRMLSNLETEKSKLIQILLVGQPGLRSLLMRPELEQLRQRITVSYHLQPLEADETAAYINHRLRRAAIGTPMEFPEAVTSLVHEQSGGVPRKINVISDAILFFGYGEARRVIDVALVKEVVQELRSTGVIPAPAPGAVPEPARRTGSTPAPALSETALAEMERDLAAREARLADRERQLADQRRILLEDYQLARMRAAVAAEPVRRPPWRTAASNAPAPGAAAGAAPLARPGPVPSSRYYQAPTSTVGDAGTIWTRLWRTLLGSGKPLFEE